MRTRYLIACLAVMLAGGLYVAPASAAMKSFVAVLNGGQETPPVASGAFGVAFLTLDDKANSLCYYVSFTRLDGGAETMAHIHSPAAPGKPAPAVVILVAGNPKNDCVTLPKANKKDLKHGMTYVNIHSSRFLNGEIRGQVIPVK